MPPLVPRLSLSDREGQRREAGRGPVQRRSLPLPKVPQLPRRDVVFGMAVLDRSGRIADKAIMESLGWKPGLRVKFAIREGLIVVAADETGSRALDERCHVLLPMRVRRACRIDGTPRVVLAALPGRQRLIVHPPALLGQLTLAVHTAALGGEL
ncbi:hypothetical protein SAMN06264365_12825 [Actinoplanes regularis]|uniref:SpoVT-AbrB domain-containing protein n=1 Tax=Actinoplanes regularis TaxID=52697 RepID=A0A239IAQ0_9ACTN|nr:hypothetical protein Are01nite_72230 [Actinoplanes regularis]SNS90637.1 hypothetical protein SAMN06264365_12825 [Actinoplanes regularis]